MIERQLQKPLEEMMFKFSNKAIVLIGPRQVGKSTLLKKIVEESGKPALMLNCDEPNVRKEFSDTNIQELKQIIGKNKIVLIDEAQRVLNIGLTLKLITDNFPDVQLLVTGSSSLDLHNALDESLTGRKFEYHLFPISTDELLETEGLISVKQRLDSRLIYGSYPEILTNVESERELLQNFSDSYLYKDLLEDENIRKPILLEKLLVALSLQVGSEVSYNEVAQTIGTDPKTVEKYIDLLEKCFVVYRLNGLSRNVRTELKKTKKVFFYDNGIRNAVIKNFAPLELRNDVGALWENFFISERIKRNEYTKNYAKIYFWRTIDQQEIDFIEERDGKFVVFEMKTNKKNAKIPSTFLKNYDVKDMMIVTRENYLECLNYEW